MKRIITIALAIALLSLLILGLFPVAADDTATVPIIVSSTTPLMINGVLTDKLPVTVSPGTLVSIVDTVQYTSQGERWTFKGWSDGEGATSITLTTGGTYVALWSREELVQISSVVPSLNKSMWLPYDVPVQLSVPDVVNASDNTRYRFQGWSGGETPFQTNNTIAPFQSMTLEAQYTLEYLLTINAPSGIAINGSGWYADGTSLVLQAPQDVYDTAQTSRQHFSSWESVGYPVMVVPTPTSAVTTIKIDGAYTLRANYDKQYLVVANSPFGTLNHDWVNENAEEQLEAQATVEIVPNEEQFVFQKWTGMEGLVSPKVAGVITQPVQLTAVYEHQYMVTLNSPNGGSGDGFHEAGSVATITVPLTSQKGLFLRSRFTGFTGYTGKDTTIQILVQSPTTVTANYSNGLDLRVFGIIIAVVLVIVFMAIWGFGRRRITG